MSALDAAPQIVDAAGMRRALLCALLSACAACSSASSEEGNPPVDSAVGTDADGEVPVAGPTGDIKGEVTRYDFAFDLDTAAAKSRLAVAVAAPGGDCFSVADALVAADEGAWNGVPASSSALDSGQLKLCGAGVGSGQPLSVGASATVSKKTFISDLDIGYSTHTDFAGGTFSYMLSWIGGCTHFGPCDPDPSKLVELHFEVTHAAGTTVLCPGVRTATATKTTCDVKGTLAPTYSAFGLAADPKWVANPFLHVDPIGLDVVLFEVPGGKLASALDKTSMTEFFTWITTLLGPMPYGKEMRFAGAPTAWLGFEHPANVVLNEGLAGMKTDYADTTTHVFMHETVHQWAGDRTTIATAQDFVWKEATAEYLAYVFEDEHRPAAEAAASLVYWSKAALYAKHYPRPTDTPLLAPEVFYGDAYGPGPMVLYVQLETMLGRAVVLKAIQAFLAAPGAKSVDELRAALEATSGKSLKPYFDAWVFGKGVPEWPSFKVKATQVGTDVTVEVTQVNASKRVFGCAIEVDVTGATKTARAVVDFGLDPKSATASAKVTLDEPVVGTKLNPRGRTIARDLGTMADRIGKMRVWIL